MQRPARGDRASGLRLPLVFLQDLLELPAVLLHVVWQQVVAEIALHEVVERGSRKAIPDQRQGQDIRHLHLQSSPIAAAWSSGCGAAAARW